jgi:hypothetical protein
MKITPAASGGQGRQVVGDVKYMPEGSGRAKSRPIVRVPMCSFLAVCAAARRACVAVLVDEDHAGGF